MIPSTSPAQSACGLWPTTTTDLSALRCPPARSRLPPIRIRVNRRRNPNDLGFIGRVDQKDTGDARMPFGDRASVIDSERLKPTDGLQERATFDEDAAAGHGRQT